MNSKCIEIVNLQKEMRGLLDGNHYISKKEYRTLLSKYVNLISFFHALKDGDMLEAFCDKNNLDDLLVIHTLNQYEKFDSEVEYHNEQFIHNKMKSDKEYLDNILKDIDPNILLDEDQRKVVLSDEDYSLVIAGAGAGKTTTIAAKVKYLVEKRNIDPKKILIISFTNKAVEELKERINTSLNMPCPISTFHSTGVAILKKQSEDKLRIVDSAKLYFVLQDYLKTKVLTDEKMVNNLILFFASYFDTPYEGDDVNIFFNKIAKSNYSTMKSELDEFKKEIVDNRTKRSITIQSEVLRSMQEVEIANFLYLNGIEYEYEQLYPYYIQNSRKPYTPDFTIKQDDKVAYIEHFGITEDGKNNRYSDDELFLYKKAINDKVKLHKSHDTTLLYTFSKYRDGRNITSHLQDQLLNHGFELRPISNEEIMKKLVTTEENRYIRKLVALICRFISNFKTNGYTAQEFDRMYNSTSNVRSRLFLSICHDCYLEYERYLKEQNAIDFEDMINQSAKLLLEVKEMKQKLDFDYVIVDEYQDISRQRFDLVKILSEITDAKIVAVGDDWQSIYAFSGSDITLFTKFAEKMGYANLLKIVNTYRNAQEVIDIAGGFIQKNPSQIRKTLYSPKNIEDPVIIYTYDSRTKDKNEDRKSGVNYATAFATEKAIEQIVEYNKKEGKNKNSILILGRFGFDGDKLEKSGLFEYNSKKQKLRSVKFPKMDITFMTAHASKGLGCDNVIIINAKNETFGFPSKIEDDPVLSFVVRHDASIEYAEERRLFYVAMTRTKNRVYFIAPEENPSEFLLEIKRDYKNVVLRGDWNELERQKKYKVCPICGYPMQYRYKNAYGLRLHICTNEPEICGFMTNEYNAQKLSILKCDECVDGYLIAKPNKNGGFFLGCTNYNAKGTGCNKTVSKDQYYKMFNLKDDAPAKETVPTESKVYRYKKKEEDIVEKAKVYMVESKLDVNGILFTILQCLLNVSQKNFYGLNIFLDVLRGATSKKIKDAKLFEIPEYGKLQFVSREKLTIIIEWMIDKHFILKTKGMYPVLHPTNEGIHYDEYLTIKMIKELEEILNN